MTPPHAVNLGVAMRASAGAQNATHLGESKCIVADGLQQMPADDEIELRVGKRYRQRIAQFEAYARAELRASRPRTIEMLLFEVDAHERGLRILRGQPLRDLGRSAADVEHRS